MERAPVDPADGSAKLHFKIFDELDKESLTKLREVFKRKVNESDYTDNGICEEEFINGIKDVYGNDLMSEEDLTTLFNIITGNKTSVGVILLKWDEFLDFMADYLKPMISKSLQLGRVEYVSPPHVKRDSIVKIVLIETEKYFCYAILSKYGRVGLYDGHFDFLTSYSVIMAREDIHRNDKERRRRNRWITDAVFQHDIQMFVITNTSRNMIIYDASGLKHIPIWLILGFPDTIQSVAYNSDEDNNKKRLCLGTDNGKIIILSFKKSKDTLFRKKHSDKLTIFYYRELSSEKENVIIKNFGRVHNEAVTSVEYFLNGRTILSCSKDPNKSVMIKTLDSKDSPIIFKMRRGANCFDFNQHLQLLITGSGDGTVRIWNILVPSKALIVLNTHKSDIVDVVIIEKLNVFLSCSKDGVLILWDLKEYYCLQTVNLTFPSFGIMGKEIEWGSKSIFPGARRFESQSVNEMKNSLWERDFILIICCNYYAKITMTYLDENENRNFDLAILPPPPLQNSFLIPKDWNMTGIESTSVENVEGVEERISVNIDHLDFIMEKNILEFCGGGTDINTKIAKLENKKLQMQWAVEKCAPYLALELYEIKEITLPSTLPVPNIKKIKSLVEKTQKMLTDASTRSVIFSELSSSSKSPRSSRSSIIEFEN